MTRPPRRQEPTDVLHIMNRGVGGLQLFKNDAEYALFLRMIDEVKSEMPFYLHCYCLMPNHFHLLVELLGFPMSEFMGLIESRYARYFNRTRSRMGHVFQGRFNAPLCDTEGYYMNVVRYIERNPIKAQLASSYGEWPWSSHRQIINRVPWSIVDRGEILSRFGGTESEALEAYLELLRVGRGLPDAFMARKAFPKASDRRLFVPWAEDELARELKSAAEAICAREGAPLEALLSRARHPQQLRLRREFCRQAAGCGYTFAEIGRFLGCSTPAASRAAKSRDTQQSAWPPECV